MTDMTLGQRIAERRKMLGLSQEAFGEKLGVSRQATSKWESDAAVPEIEKLITMSRLFGVSMDWLLGVENDSPDIPAEQETVTPEPVAVSQPEEAPAQPRRKMRWPMAVCAAVTAVSLSAVIPALIWGGGLKTQITELTQTNQQLQTRLDDAGSASASLEASFQEQADQIVSQNNQIDALEERISNLREEKQELAEQLDSGKWQTELWRVQTIGDTETQLQWQLSAIANATLDGIELRFSGMLNETDGGAMPVFRVMQDGQLVKEARCRQFDPIFTASLELAAADNYSYYIILTGADGTEKWVELSGHELSDLENALHFTRMVKHFREDKVSSGGEKFWLTYSEVCVSLPELLPTDVTVSWVNMRLTYYYNGEAAEERSLSEVCSTLSEESNRSLRFSTPTLTFAMPGREEGSSHQIWLEGTVLIDGNEIPVRLPLTQCAMTGGVLVPKSL